MSDEERDDRPDEMLERARATEEAIEKFAPETPALHRALAVSVGALGGDPVPIIGAGLGLVELAKMERENPQQGRPDDYTEAERRIVEMFTENTGLGGGFPGQEAWVHNRRVRDFRELPAFRVEEWRDDHPPWIVVDSFQVLRRSLGVDGVSEAIEEALKKYIEEHEKGNWEGRSIDRFCRALEDEKNRDVVVVVDGKEIRFTHSDVCMTVYQSGEMMPVSVDFRLWELSRRATEDDYCTDSYAILSVHGGADLRGGYTGPRVFSLDGDADEIESDLTHASAECGCLEISGNIMDDYWDRYGEDGSGGKHEFHDDSMRHGWPKKWHLEGDDDRQFLRCELCGGEIRVNAG